MRKRAPKSATKASGFRSPPDRSLKRPSKPFDFDAGFMDAASKPLAPSPAASVPTTPTSISDLKDLASSRMDSLKRYLDLYNAEVLKEINAFDSRISKRFKIQTQACLQTTEETEKEHKKILEKVNENMDQLKASYMEIIKETQASTTRVFKEKIPELARSMEKAVESLRSRCRTPANPIQSSNSLHFYTSSS